MIPAGPLVSEKTHFNKLADKFQRQWWGGYTYAGQRRALRRAKITGLYSDKDDWTLEIGCSIGDFSYKLAQEGFSPIVSIDISEKLVKIAVKKNMYKHIFYVVGDIEHLPFKRVFNAVVGNAILHHLNIDKIFKELQNVVRGSARFIFFEPNLLNPEVWLEKKIKPIGFLLQNSPTEIAFYKWKIKKKLQNLGCKQVEVIPFDFLHPIIPKILTPIMEKIGNFLEKIPFIKEISGSLIIKGRFI